MSLSARNDMVMKTIEEMLVLYINKIDIGEYLKNNMGIDNICLYGMGKLGKYFYRSIQGSSINIVACVDNNTQIQYDNIEIISRSDLSDYAKEIDVFIVTSEYYFDDIRSELEVYYDAKIVLLRDILEELLMSEYCYI